MPSATRQAAVFLWTGLMLVSGAGCASWSFFQPPPPPVPSPSSSAIQATSEIVIPKSPESGPKDSSAQAPVGSLESLMSSPEGPQEVPELTLQRLIEIGLENQPNIFASQAARNAASAELGIAQSSYFPVIGATLGFSRTTQNVAQGVSASTGNPIPRNISNRSVNSQNYVITLSQNVFDSFQREWGVTAAREQLNASDLDLSTTRQNVILGVQQTYYNYLLALHLVAVQQEAVNANTQNLNQVKGFFEVGTRPKIDVTQAQVQLANAELALVQARNQAATALAALNNAIGVPTHPPYRLKEELEIAPTIPSLDESIQAALRNRTEILSVQARIREAEANLKVAKNNFLPTLSANASWSYRGQNLPLAPNWIAGMSVTVPVLNPPLFSQLDSVAANLASAQASAEITRQNVILEVQQNYANLLGAKESIRTSEVLLEEARESLELARGRYQVGVGPLIDITNAQLALTQAEDQNIQAIVNFKLAEAGLRKALGLLQ
jgi:outer membrane protein